MNAERILHRVVRTPALVVLSPVFLIAVPITTLLVWLLSGPDDFRFLMKCLRDKD